MLLMVEISIVTDTKQTNNTQRWDDVRKLCARNNPVERLIAIVRVFDEQNLVFKGDVIAWRKKVAFHNFSIFDFWHKKQMQLYLTHFSYSKIETIQKGILRWIRRTSSAYHWILGFWISILRHVFYSWMKSNCQNIGLV